MNTKEKTIHLFPKPLIVIENLFLDKLDFIEKFLKQQIQETGYKRTATQNVNTTFNTNTELYKKEELKFLTDFIRQKSISFITALEYSDNYINRCKFDEMWFNISEEGDFLFPHHHGFCLVSGVYYIKAPKDSTITFYNHSHFYPNHIEVKKPNMFNSPYISMSCTPGTLLLFKSEMLHGNKLQPKGEKIAISFNLGI